MIGKKREKEEEEEKIEGEKRIRVNFRQKFSKNQYSICFQKDGHLYRSGSTRGHLVFYRDKCSPRLVYTHLFSPLPRVIENVRQCVVQRTRLEY